MYAYILTGIKIGCTNKHILDTSVCVCVCCARRLSILHDKFHTRGAIREKTLLCRGMYFRFMCLYIHRCCIYIYIYIYVYTCCMWWGAYCTLFANIAFCLLAVDIFLPIAHCLSPVAYCPLFFAYWPIIVLAHSLMGSHNRKLSNFA